MLSLLISSSDLFAIALAAVLMTAIHRRNYIPPGLVVVGVLAYVITAAYATPENSTTTRQYYVNPHLSPPDRRPGVAEDPARYARPYTNQWGDLRIFDDIAYNTPTQEEIRQYLFPSKRAAWCGPLCEGVNFAAEHAATYIIRFVKPERFSRYRTLPLPPIAVPRLELEEKSPYYMWPAWTVILLAIGTLSLLISLAFIPPIPVRDSVRYVASAFLASLQARCIKDSRRLKDVFHKMPFVAVRKARNHTHANAATLRTSASMYAENYSKAVEMQPYFYQKSYADQKNNRLGSRAFFFAKDYDASPEMYAPPEDALLILVDVDYYPDMNEFLAENFKPIMLFTFVPEAAARSRGDTRHFFLPDGRVKLTTTGGGTYTHELWDYSSDHVVVNTFWSHSMFKIERKQIGKDRQLIMFFPVAKWHGLGAWVARSLCVTTPLKRWNPVTPAKFGDDFIVRITIHAESDVQVSTGLTNSFASVTIPAVEDARLALTSMNGSSALSIGVLKATTGDLGPDQAVELLLSFHRMKRTIPSCSVYTLENSVIPYTTIMHSPDPIEARPAVVPFMPALIGEAYAPLAGRDMEAAAVVTRVESIASDVKEMDPYTVRAAYQFAELVFPTQGVLTPASHDVTHEMQDRPQQKRLIAEGENMGDMPNRTVKSFLKKEAGSKDPRLISTINPKDKVDYSSVMYAFSEYLKETTQWYAFGKTPMDTSATVVVLLMHAMKISEAEAWALIVDFSRMDGRISAAVRQFEEIMLRRGFSAEDIDNVITLWKTQQRQRARTTNGIKYNTGTSRLSGSPETSALNTLLAAFIAFLALMDMGYTAEEAYKKLGIYGGDDGFTTNIDKSCYERAAAKLGQVLTVETVRPGEAILFLGRWHSPSAWYGVANTMCDVSRQLLKFHVTPQVNAVMRPQDKLVQKAMSVLATDANTPILGPLCRRVRDLAGSEVFKTDRALRKWRDSTPSEDQWPNYPDDWMVAIVEKEIPDFDYTTFNKHLADSNTLEELMKMPCCVPPRPVKVADGYVANPFGDHPQPFGAPLPDPKGKSEVPNATQAVMPSQVSAADKVPIPSAIPSAVRKQPDGQTMSRNTFNGRGRGAPRGRGSRGRGAK